MLKKGGIQPVFTTKLLMLKQEIVCYSIYFHYTIALGREEEKRIDQLMNKSILNSNKQTNNHLFGAFISLPTLY